MFIFAVFVTSRRNRRNRAARCVTCNAKRAQVDRWLSEPVFRF